MAEQRVLWAVGSVEEGIDKRVDSPERAAEILRWVRAANLTPLCQRVVETVEDVTDLDTFMQDHYRG